MDITAENMSKGVNAELSAKPLLLRFSAVKKI